MNVIPKISVIVPVYNAGEYLRRCIDSILVQTFTNFELLLIDDGSTDDSGNICDEYAEWDFRIRVFHKKNSGVSDTRNLGLDNAEGEWIIFVDADDYLYKDAFERLLKESRADLIVGGFLRIYVGSRRETAFSPGDRKINIRAGAGELKNKLERYLTTPWCKLFKNDIIRERYLRFNNDLFYGEDTDFVFRYVFQIDTIRFIPDLVYCYWDTENRLDRYILNARHFRKLTDCTYRNFELLAKKTNVSFPEIRNTFLRDYSSLYIIGVTNIHSHGDFLKEAKAYKMEKCVCLADSFKYKAFIAMLNYCPSLAYLCIRLYRSVCK